MRQDRQAGGNGITVHLRGKPAMAVQESLQQGLGVVKASGAGPAVGTAENRGITVPGLYPLQFRCDERQRRIPGNRDKGFAAAPRAAAGGPVFQPSRADHRFRHPAFVIQRGGHRIEDFRGVGISLGRRNTDDTAVFHLGGKGAPMGAVIDLAHVFPNRFQALTTTRTAKNWPVPVIRSAIFRFLAHLGDF